MKTFLALVGCISLSTSALAQGTITFRNADLPNPSGGGTYNAMIMVPVQERYPNGERVNQGPWPGPGPRLHDYMRGLGPGFTAGLFLEGSNVPLATTTFVSDFGPEFMWILNDIEVIVPNAPPGSSPALYVAAWGPFWDDPEVRGRSATFYPSPLGGPNPAGGPPFPSPSTTFQGFSVFTTGPTGNFIIVVVPEPSIVALCNLAAAAIFLRRRSR